MEQFKINSNRLCPHIPRSCIYICYSFSIALGIERESALAVAYDKSVVNTHIVTSSPVVAISPAYITTTSQQCMTQCSLYLPVLLTVTGQCETWVEHGSRL